MDIVKKKTFKDNKLILPHIIFNIYKALMSWTPSDYVLVFKWAYVTEPTGNINKLNFIIFKVKVELGMDLLQYIMYYFDLWVARWTSKSVIGLYKYFTSKTAKMNYQCTLLAGKIWLCNTRCLILNNELKLRTSNMANKKEHYPGHIKLANCNS